LRRSQEDTLVKILLETIQLYFY